jgi:cytochrome c553
MVIFLLVVICCLLVACSSYKVEYAFPEDAKKMQGYDELMTHIEAGKKLYKAHCTGCHGIFTKGKKEIPNFSRVQLDNYNSNFIKKDPKNHAVAQKLSKDQLGDIIIFLTFVKKNKQD